MAGEISNQQWCTRGNKLNFNELLKPKDAGKQCHVPARNEDVIGDRISIASPSGIVTKSMKIIITEEDERA